MLDNTIKPNPGLIPRFNLDFDFTEFWFSIKAILRNEPLHQEILNTIFGSKTFFFTNYGRSALFVILKSLDIPPKSRIGVPLYSCTVVFDAIINAGFVPVFIDIDSNYTVDPEDLEKKIDDIEAVVVIHTFGRPADMDRIKEIAGDKPVIEDCAHSLLSEYKGKITGTIGDVSYFSLAKYISIGGGGMIIVNNNNMIENIGVNVDSLEIPSWWGEIKDTFIAYMRSFFYHKPWFGLFALPLGSSIEDKVDLMNKRTFKITAINKGDLNLMLKKLAEFKVQVEQQRMNSFYLMDKLKDTSIILPYEKADTYCNFYLFPVLFESQKQRDKAGIELRRSGVDTAMLFSNVPQIARDIYGYQNDCPNTEDIAERILTIPNHYTLNRIELRKIVSLTTGVCV